MEFEEKGHRHALLGAVLRSLSFGCVVGGCMFLLRTPITEKIIINGEYNEPENYILLVFGVPILIGLAGFIIRHKRRETSKEGA